MARLCAPNARGLGSIPGQGTRSHMPQLRPKQPNKLKKKFFFKKSYQAVRSQLLHNICLSIAHSLYYITLVQMTLKCEL